MEHSDRKRIRLESFDYSQNGLYFITICTKDRIPYLSRIIPSENVGEAALGLPLIELTDIGKTVNDQYK